MSQGQKIQTCAGCSPVKFKGETTIVCSNPRVLVQRYKQDLIPAGVLEPQATDVNHETEIQILDKTNIKGKKSTKRQRAMPQKSSKSKLKLKKSISSQSLNEVLLNPLQDLNETDDFASVLDKHLTKKKKSVHTKSAVAVKSIIKSSEEKNDNQIYVPKQEEKEFDSPLLNSGEENPNEEDKDTLSSAESSDDHKLCLICNKPVENELLTDHLKTCLNKHFNREMKKQEVGRRTQLVSTEIPVEMVLCQICHVDLSELSPYRQSVHVNSCIDKTGLTNETKTDSGKETSDVLPCPMCGKPLKTKTLRNRHIKKCSSMYGVADYTLDNLIQKQIIEMNKQGSITTNQAEPKAGNVTLNNRNIENIEPAKGKGTRGQIKKSKNLTKVIDEDTEFAMALSTSMIEEQQKQQNILLERLETIDRQAVGCKKSDKDIKKSRKKKTGFSRSPEKLPPLLQQTTEEIRHKIAERVGQIITLMDEIPIDNTPKFESSNLGEKINQTARDSGSSSSVESPTLWRKCSLEVGSADMYYVQQLSDHVSMQANKPGTPTCSLPATPGQRKSSKHEKYSAGTNTMEEESLGIVSTQTAVVLAELASECYLQSCDQSKCWQDQTNISSISKNGSSGIEVDVGHVSHQAVDVQCETSEDLTSSGFCPQKEEEKAAQISSLGSDLSAMVNNPLFSDLRICTAEGKRIHGHKMILAARCPCLLEALQSGAELDFENFSYSVVLTVLKFVYTAEIPQTLDIQCLNLAKRLGLAGLSDFYDNKELMECQLSNNHEEGDRNIEELITTFFSGSSDSEADNDDQSTDQIEEEEMDSLYEFMFTQREKSSPNKGGNLSGKSTEYVKIGTYKLDSCDGNNLTPVKTNLSDEEIQVLAIQTEYSNESKSSNISDSETSQQSHNDVKMKECELSESGLSDNLHNKCRIRKKHSKSLNKSKRRRTISSSNSDSDVNVSDNKRRKTDIEDGKISKTPERVHVTLLERDSPSPSSYSENTENQFKEVHSMLNELSPGGVNMSKLQWPNVSDVSEKTLNKRQPTSTKDSLCNGDIQQASGPSNSPSLRSHYSPSRGGPGANTELSEEEIELFGTSECDEKTYSLQLLDESKGTILCQSGGKSFIVTPQFKLSLLNHAPLLQNEENKSEIKQINKKKSAKERNSMTSSLELQTKQQDDCSLNTSDSWLIPDTPAKTSSFTYTKSFSVSDKTKSTLTQPMSSKNSEKKVCSYESIENSEFSALSSETSTDVCNTLTESVNFKQLAKCQPSFSNAFMSTPVSGQSRRTLFSHQKYSTSLNSKSDLNNCSVIENACPESSHNSNNSLDLRREESKELSAHARLKTSDSNSSQQDSDVEIINDEFEKPVSPKFPRKRGQSQRGKLYSPLPQDNTKDLGVDQIENLLKDVDNFFGKSPSTNRVNISNKVLKAPVLTPSDIEEETQIKSINHDVDELPEISGPQFNNSPQSSQTSVIIEADIHHSLFEEQNNESPVKEKKKESRKYTFKKLKDKQKNSGSCIQENDEITLMSSEISYTASRRSSRKKHKSPAPYCPPDIVDLSDPEPSCPSMQDDVPVFSNQSEMQCPETSSVEDQGDKACDSDTVEDVWADFDDAGMEFNPGLCDSPEKTLASNDSSDTEVEGAGDFDGVNLSPGPGLETPSVELTSSPAPPSSVTSSLPDSPVTPQGCPVEFDSPPPEVDYLEQFENMNDSFQWQQNVVQVDDQCEIISTKPVLMTKTPTCTLKKRTKSKKKWIPPSPFTPLPEYDKMNTPGLKKEMHKYGIKPVSKKRMVLCLTDIYHQTHQYETDSEAEITIIQDDEKINPVLESKRDRPKQLLENKGKIQATKAGKKSTSTLLQKLKTKLVNKQKTAESCSGGDLDDLSAEYDGSDDEDDSSESDVVEESFMADEDDIPFSQQENNPNLQQELHKFFTSDPSLYCRVLMYEPLALDWLKDEVKKAGIKCSADKLIKYLDEKCIMFTMKNTNNRQRGRRKKVKKTSNITKQ